MSHLSPAGLKGLDDISSKLYCTAKGKSYILSGMSLNFRGSLCSMTSSSELHLLLNYKRLYNPLHWTGAVYICTNYSEVDQPFLWTKHTLKNFKILKNWYEQTTNPYYASPGNSFSFFSSLPLFPFSFSTYFLPIASCLISFPISFQTIQLPKLTTKVLLHSPLNLVFQWGKKKIIF